MPRHRHRRGFTLVELLVVIAIIGILVALLLPAVQAAREAARRNTCKNNLKQMALGWMNHESSAGNFPTGGWGHKWVGDADRGFKRHQPGGWSYNMMPFIEEQTLYDLASDGARDVITQAQREGATKIVKSPIAVVTCPSRRAAGDLHTVRPGDWDFADNAQRFSIAEFAMVGRSDYVSCSGDSGRTWISSSKQPRAGLSGDVQMPDVGPRPYNDWCWDTTGNPMNDCGDLPLNGVSFPRSEISLRHVTDGSSKTYMIGEKFMSSDHYTDGVDQGDEETWITGFNDVTHRNARYSPHKDVPSQLRQKAQLLGSAVPMRAIGTPPSAMAASRSWDTTSISKCTAALPTATTESPASCRSAVGTPPRLPYLHSPSEEADATTRVAAIIRATLPRVSSARAVCGFSTPALAFHWIAAQRRRLSRGREPTVWFWTTTQPRTPKAITVAESTLVWLSPLRGWLYWPFWLDRNRMAAASAICCGKPQDLCFEAEQKQDKNATRVFGSPGLGGRRCQPVRLCATVGVLWHGRSRCL